MTPERFKEYEKTFKRKATMVSAKPNVINMTPAQLEEFLGKPVGSAPRQMKKEPLTLKERYEKQIRENMKANDQAFEAVLAREKSEREKKKNAEEIWQPVTANYPVLVYDYGAFPPFHKMDDFTAPDMLHGNQSREMIEQYGLGQPFKQSHHAVGNYTWDGEDQFTLPASEHFKRMRGLADDVLFIFGFSTSGETKGLFKEMVDKFERNEGEYYSNPLLDKALKEHDSTANFHAALLKCLEQNIHDGRLDSHIVELSNQYMRSDKGAKLVQFSNWDDYFNGTVLTVHGIWSIRVYAEKLEYKGNQIRGVFRYDVQDHFGLNPEDINHSKLTNAFEKFEGFRSWYLLQHYRGYGYKPFITQITFTK